MCAAPHRLTEPCTVNKYEHSDGDPGECFEGPTMSNMCPGHAARMARYTQRAYWGLPLWGEDKDGD